MLQKAQVATERLALCWVSREESSWTARLSTLDSAHGFASSSWATLEDIISLIKDVDAAWRSNLIYFSKPVSDAVNDFLRTVCTDLEAQQSLIEQQKKARDPGKPSLSRNSMKRVLGSVKSRLIRD